MQLVRLDVPSSCYAMCCHMEYFNKGKEYASAYAVQAGILGTILLAYCLGTILFTPRWLLIVAGIALPCAAAALGKATAMKKYYAMEPPLVWGVGTFTLSMISITVQFPVTISAAALVATNSFVLVGAWAVHRFPSQHPAPTQNVAQTVLTSTLLGFGIAVFVALFATVIFLIGAFSGDSTFNLYNWSVLVLAYVAAGLLGGILVGLLRPITPYPLGRMLIGIPVAILIYGFIGIAMLVTGIGDGPETFREALGIGIGIGVIAGPMGALTFHGGVWADELKDPPLTARTGAL